jgi:hypothetical protein
LEAQDSQLHIFSEGQWQFRKKKHTQNVLLPSFQGTQHETLVEILPLTDWLVTQIPAKNFFQTCVSAPDFFPLQPKVTAVLVEGALANAANDKELGRHDMKQKACCG